MTKENDAPGTETKSKFKLSLDSAKKEINRMMDYYEIDIDEIEDETLKKAIKDGYGRAIKAIRRGRLEVIIEDGIKVVQETKNGTKIEYREIDGEAKTAMDSYPAEAIYKRAYALLGALSGLGEGVIKKMKGVDLSLAEVLGLIFLAV